MNQQVFDQFESGQKNQSIIESASFTYNRCPTGIAIKLESLFFKKDFAKSAPSPSF